MGEDDGGNIGMRFKLIHEADSSVVDDDNGIGALISDLFVVRYY
jgi:hypothetical protein